MSKKNTPDAPGKKNQPASEAQEPAKKRSGFISDFDMWGMSLDMSGDETIDANVRSGETAKKPAPDVSDPVTESRAKASSIQSRTAKPAPGPRQAATGKPASVAPSKARTASTPPQSQTKTVHNSEAKKHSPQPLRQQQSSSRPSSQAGSSVAKASSNARKHVSGKGAGSTAQGSGSRGDRDRQRHSGSSRSTGQPAARAKQSGAEAVQEAAVFTTRDINRTIIPQNVKRVDELKKKRRRDKFLKFASLLWVVFDALWVLIVKLAKLAARLAPVLYRYKLPVGAALVSFFLGVYFGGQGSDAPVASVAKVTTAANEQAQEIKHHSKPVKKPARSNNPVAGKQLGEPSHQAINTAAGQSGLVNENPDMPQQPLAQNQFSGKDIPVADEADTAAATVADAAPDMAGDALKDAAPAAPPQSADAPMSATESGTGQQPAPENAGSSEAGTESPDQAMNQGEAPQQAAPAVANAQAEDTELKRLLDENLTYFNQKQWQQVVDSSNKILALKPFTEAALINRSAAYTELGQYELAIDDTNTLIIMNKKNAIAFNNRGYAYEKAGLPVKAIADYETACRLGIQQSCNDVQRLRGQLPASE